MTHTWSEAVEVTVKMNNILIKTFKEAVFSIVDINFCFNITI